MRAILTAMAVIPSPPVGAFPQCSANLFIPFADHANVLGAYTMLMRLSNVKNT